MNEKYYVNIITVGRKSAGKSAFLNYFLQSPDFRSDELSGNSVDLELNMVDDTNGVSLKIINTAGFELDELPNIKGQIINDLKEQLEGGDVSKWVHSVFYCINVKNGIENTEADLITEICSSISCTLHIVLTNCDTPNAKDAVELRNYIESNVKATNYKIINVNSEEAEFETFGRQEALEAVFHDLWSDISLNVAAEYAKELKYSLDGLYSDMFSKFDHSANNMFSALFTGFTDLDSADDLFDDNDGKELFDNEGFDEDLSGLLEEFGEKCDAEQELLNSKYKEIVDSLAELCNSYSASLGYKLEWLSFVDFVPEKYVKRIEKLDVDDLVENSEMQKLADSMDEMDDNMSFDAFLNIAEIMSNMGSAVNNTLTDLKNEMRKTLPTEEEIREEIYRQLMDAVC